MAFQNSPVYYFRDVTETGINKVPDNKLIVVQSTSETFLKVSSTGLTAATTIQNAIDSGIIESVSGLDTEAVNALVQDSINDGSIDLTSGLNPSAMLEVGTGPNDIPTNAQLSTAALLNIGTGPDDIPKNKNIVVPVTTVINKPSITAPANGNVGFNGAITSTPYSTTPLFFGVHDKTHWQLSDKADFSTILAVSTTGNLTSWSPGASPSNKVVYIRVRYGSNGHWSDWSNTISYTTPNITIKTPTLTVPGAPSSISYGPTITTSAFEVNNGTDTHASTDWQIYQGNTLVWQSLNNTANKTSIKVPDNVLNQNTAYIFKARHNGTNYGSSAYVEVNGTTISNWSGEAVFTTPGTFQWICPPEITSVSVLCVGTGGYGYRDSSGVTTGNGGHSGALAWKNNIPVTPGNSYTVFIPSSSIQNGETNITGKSTYFDSLQLIYAQRGASAMYNHAALFNGDGGGKGSVGGSPNGGGGGGGAPGYGSNGVGPNEIPTLGGGGYSTYSGYSGGGVGLYGQGPSGMSGSIGTGGSGGEGGSSSGAKYGAGGRNDGLGGSGAVRIIWGPGRSFPHNAS